MVKQYNDDQREALQKLSQYLKSIRKLVGVLGTECLDDFCRYGHLPKEKITQIEELEAWLPGEANGEEGEESAMDSDAD